MHHPLLKIVGISWRNHSLTHPSQASWHQQILSSNVGASLQSATDLENDRYEQCFIWHFCFAKFCQFSYMGFYHIIEQSQTGQGRFGAGNLWQSSHVCPNDLMEMTFLVYKKGYRLLHNRSCHQWEAVQVWPWMHHPATVLSSSWISEIYHGTTMFMWGITRTGSLGEATSVSQHHVRDWVEGRSRWQGLLEQEEWNDCPNCTTRTRVELYDIHVTQNSNQKQNKKNSWTQCLHLI